MTLARGKREGKKPEWEKEGCSGVQEQWFWLGEDERSESRTLKVSTYVSGEEGACRISELW